MVSILWRVQRRTRRQARRHRGEEGVSLVIALAILSVFGIGIGLILGEAQVNFKSTEVTGTVRNMTYAADAGIEYGISKAQSGYCSAPRTSLPPAPLSLGTVPNLTEPGINPTTTVTCTTTSGNSLANTFGGSEGSPGYSVVTNSPPGTGCISLASDKVGASNQIHYSAASHCATFGSSTNPVLWIDAGAPTTNVNGATFSLNGDSFWQDPTTQNVYGWAVGTNSTILSYDGSTWTPVSCSNCANNLTLNAVYAFSSTSVWAVGQAGVLLENTGNDAWQQVTSTVIGGTNLNSVFVEDATDIWAVGASGAIFYINLNNTDPTKCNGALQCVTKQTVPGGTKNLNGIGGGLSAGTPGAWTLWAVGDSGTILTSSNQGSTWTGQTSGTTQNLEAMAAVSATRGWVVGANETLLSTSNGTSWGPVASPPPASANQLNGVWAYDDGAGNDTVFAVGNGGLIDYRDPSTGTWSAQNSGVTTNFQSVGGTPPAGGFQVHAVGGSAVYDFEGIPNPNGTPTNNGPPWVQQASPVTQTLNEVSGAPGTTKVYAVGTNQANNETIVSTSDGTHWSKLSLAVSKGQPLYGVYTPDGTNVWAVGGGGQIYYSSNGTSFASQPSGVTVQLNAVFALSSTQAWAVGNASGGKETVLAYNSGSWTSIGPSVSKAQPLYGVWAADASHVWVVGGGGQIYFYNGTTWTAQTSGTNQQLNAVGGTDSGHVWAAGKHQGTNVTLVSYGGGSSWSLVGITSPRAQDLNDVFALSNGGVPNVYAVGASGFVYFWDGSSWTQQLGPSNKTTLYGVTATGTGAGQGWAVGAGGAIWNFNPFSPTGMSITSGGSVFNAGGVQLSSTLDVSDGSFVQGGQATCTPAPSVPPSLAGELYYFGTYGCSTNTQQPASVALPTLPIASWVGSDGSTCLPTSNHSYTAACKRNPNPAAQNKGGTCTKFVQYTPGIYNGAFKFATNTTYFFPSGIYYLDNVGNVVFNVSGSYLIGGTPAVGDSASVAGGSPCWNYITSTAEPLDSQTNPTGNPRGVEFILGGNTTLQLQTGTVELFARTGANPASDGTQNISVRESCSLGTSALSSPISCTGGWDASNIGGNDQIFRVNGGGNLSYNLHGSIYTPDHNVELYSNKVGTQAVAGAVDCWSLELAVQGYSSPAVQPQAAGPFAVRTITFTAYAIGGTGTVPAKEEAYITLDSPGVDDVLGVADWRYCSPPGTPTSACAA